jgi:Spy/CpxP family protein refolding chaperone
MKSFRSRLLVAAMAVLMGSALAKSQTADAPPAPPMHDHAYGMHEHGMGFFGKKLNLTDEQKTQMKAIMQKEHPAMKPLFEQQRQIDQQLRQYVEGQFDEAKVQALATLYALLTPEQQSKLKEMEARHESRRQERMNRQAPAAPPAQ